MRCKNRLISTALVFHRSKSFILSQRHDLFCRLSSSFIDQQPSANDVIFVAMSAGVDSSFVASEMSSKFKTVVGVYMENWTIPRTSTKERWQRGNKRLPSRIQSNPAKVQAYLEDQARRDKEMAQSAATCAEVDWNDVQTLGKYLNIPVIRISLERDYWTDVFWPMISGYEEGATPNADVTCNRNIKFGKLYDQVCRIATEKYAGRKWWLATGHYARIARHETTGRLALLQPVDASKDQSFYLSTIDRSRLHNLIFPLHEYNKKTVRQLAMERDLPTAYRPDSHGLCFVAPNPGAAAAKKAHQEGRKLPRSTGYAHFRDFLDEFLDPNPGNIVTVDGEVAGTHNGLWHATIGQRSGVTMAQHDPNLRGIWYVVDKRVARNEIVIARGNKNRWLFSTAMNCKDWVWMIEHDEIDDILNHSELPVQARWRPLQAKVPVKAVHVFPGGGGGGGGNHQITVEFENPEHGVTYGQTAVLYVGDRVIGGGIIEDRKLPPETFKMETNQRTMDETHL
ncbi:tRNA-specific 2-thiouridylase [Lipomyces japonicus]|uniref:tRNA-specific 2-thiouridylase n=1 Tax=Lipomyces japonicus TaxID=56871 RepID=UPI0034CF7A3F